MNSDASKTKIAPPLAIQSGAPSPYRFATDPASAGAIAPPTISPTSVASPIAVAANFAGTLSVGTSTRTSAAIPCPPFARNPAVAISHGCAIRNGTWYVSGAAAEISATKINVGLRPARSEIQGKIQPQRNAPNPPAPMINPAKVADRCETSVIYSGANTCMTNSHVMKPAAPKQQSHILRYRSSVK